MVSRLHQKVKKLLELAPDSELVIKYNMTARSDLMAGKDPKWLLINAEDLKLVPLTGNGPHSAGTFLKVLREEDMWVAKERARELWMKISRVCRQLRFQRHGGLGGLVGAAHLSLLKTLETGGRQWIRGTAQREKLKEALATFGMKIASEAVESGNSLAA